MREMKDSGVKWIGAIPTDWQVDNPKYHFTQRKDRAKQGMVQLTASQKHGVITQTEYMERTGANIVTVQKDFDILKLVCAGDFVIHMRSFQGGLEYSEKTGSISSAYVMLIPGETICEPRYYKWFFKSSNYIDALSSTSNLVRDGQAMRWANFIQLPIAFPPAAEQKRISDFLDVKCTEIDALIANVQAQIDILEQYKRSVITETVTKGLNPDAEQKDSGIQWIGMMPSHWNSIRGKYILKYIQKPVREDDGVITCFRDGEVTLRSNRREDGFTMADKEIGYQGIDIGDLVVHGMDGFAGAIGISDSRGKASPVLNVLDTEQNKRYIMYFLRSMAYSDVFLAMATGIRVRSCDLRWNKLAELFYPVPPIEEQEAIVEYIDSVLAKANDVISAKKEQLAVLEAYKKSLIFEYVTGKKEVPAPITAVMVDPNVILLGKLPKLLNQQKGKIYNQKVLYLLNTYLGLNLGVQYYRYKHGPYDIMLDSYIDTLVENGWCVKTIKNGAENLEIGPNYGAFEEKYGSHFSEFDAEINSLVQFVQPMKRSQIERIATLFAVWNDMILDGKSTPTDAEIVSEVMSGWTENKANFAYDTWVGTLNKMRTNGIVPKGQGLHTLPREC